MSLTEDDVDTVIMMLAIGQRKFTEDDARRAVEEIGAMVMAGAMAGLVLKGVLCIAYKNGELTFREVGACK
jgi:hypothetical protein